MIRDWWDGFDLAEKFFIELSVMVIKFSAIASLAGCATAAATPSNRMADAHVIVADVDTQITRPKLPDQLAPKTGSTGAVAKPQVETACRIAPATVSAKPLVQVFTTGGCPPCVEAKRDLKASKVPFYLMPAPNPKWTEEHGFPALAWQVGNAWHYQFGWSGLEAFQKHYESTFRLKVQTASAMPIRSSGPRWTWPGDVGEHLVSDHGYSWAQVRGMSQAQRIAAHDAAHNGYAVAPKRRRIRTVANACPGGRCP